MQPLIRNVFPAAAALFAVAAVAYALSFGTLPPADFSFHNGDEIKTVDPQKATGQPENRVVNALFEGLLRTLPDLENINDDGVAPLKPAPGVAERWTVSDDGLVYTFHLRKDARWSDGSPLTAHDFAWSWRRALHPETASQYAFQLYYLSGGKAYNSSRVAPGDRVEVELADRPVALQTFPRGTIVRGVLTEIIEPPNRPSDEAADEQALERWLARRVFVVEVKGEGDDSQLDWEAPGERRAFCRNPSQAAPHALNAPIERLQYLLPDFATTVGVRVVDDHTLEARLDHSTPYFPYLCAFYTYFPVQRACIERHGAPNWTRPENLVCNGPYRLGFRRIRDRVRMMKNPEYWDAANVQLEVVDALAVKQQTTALNMYLSGQLDWVTDVPRSIVPDLLAREDFRPAPQLTTYFYRLNVTRKPLDDKRVRQALNLAINKRRIVESVTQAGEQPARSITPPGLAGYVPPQCGEYNIEEARRLLAEAGFPGGRGLPKLEILYNTSDNHRAIAEVIERDWRQLGVDVELRNLEWGVYLDAMHSTDYTVARAGWVGDYPDPNTFLDMWLTGGEQNNTNWGNPEYDRLIAAAGAETDPAARLEILHQAETILMDELPIIPIYFYVSMNLVHPRVRGFHANVLDQHPIGLLSVEEP